MLDPLDTVQAFGLGEGTAGRDRVRARQGGRRHLLHDDRRHVPQEPRRAARDAHLLVPAHDRARRGRCSCSSGCCCTCRRGSARRRSRRRSAGAWGSAPPRRRCRSASRWPGSCCSQPCSAPRVAIAAAQPVVKQIDPLPDRLPSPVFVVPSTSILVAVGALVLVAIATGFITSWLARRTDVSEALRVA